MESYIEAFNKALVRTDTLYGRRSNYPLEIDSSKAIDLEAAAAAIGDDFSTFITNTDLLPGLCFRIARELSYVLFECGIRHTVTVGDIQLADGLYIGVTLAQILEDVAGGYQLDARDGMPVGKPINAHAWITLENGSVIDATVLASQHRKKEHAKQLLSFKDAVFYTGKTDTPVVRHIPMLTGFVYHQRVLTAPIDGDFSNYCQWYNDYAVSMARYDLEFLIPELRQFRVRR